MGQRFEKLDANETIWFSRELESIDQRDYTELLPGALARKYIPDYSAPVPSWAKSYSYKMFRLRGKVAAGGPNSDDAPRASLYATETVGAVKEFDESYSWTVKEVQAAAATRKPLEQLTVLAARSAMNLKIDRVLALGDSDLGITGLLNNGDIDDSTNPLAKTTGTTWAANAGNSADRAGSKASHRVAAAGKGTLRNSGNGGQLGWLAPRPD